MLHLDAGKYAIFLWPAYGLSAGVLFFLIVQTLVNARRWRLAAQRRKGETPGS